MSDLKALFRDSSHYLTGQVAALALGFVSFPIFTRVLSVAEYGMLCLTLQIAAMATVLSKMGLQNSIQRFYQEHAASSESGALRKFYSTLLFGASLCALAVVILFVVGLELIPGSLVSPAFRKVLLLGSLLIFTRGMQPIVMNFLRAQRRTKAFNVYDVLSKALSLGVVCVLVFTWNRSVNTVLIGTVTVELASVVLLAFLLLPRDVVSFTSFDQRLFSAALIFGFPLVGYELAGVILDTGDRILVQHYLGFQAVGYYSAGYNMANYVATSLMYPVNLALFPIYMKLWTTKGAQETRAFLSGALDKFIMAALCVLAAVSVTARDAVIVLGSRKLQQAYPLLPILVLGLMIYSLHIFFNAGLIIHKKTLTMAKIISFSAALNVMLNVLLIPRIGLQGAALATLLSYGVFLGLIIRASSAVLPLRVDFRACLRYVGAAAVSALLASRIHFSSEFVSLAVRGSLSVVTYAAVLWMIDPGLRQVANAAVSSVCESLNKSSRQSEMATIPVVEGEAVEAGAQH
jgi:O-antigen/teichoic acid export membrane protein